MINIFYFANNFRTTYIKKNIRKNLAINFPTFLPIHKCYIEIYKKKINRNRKK